MESYQICKKKLIGNSYQNYQYFEIDSKNINFGEIKNFDNFYEIELETDCIVNVSQKDDFQYYYDKKLILYEGNIYFHDRFLEKLYEKYDDLKGLFNDGYIICLCDNILYVCCRKNYTDYTKIALFKNIILNNKINNILEKILPIIENFSKMQNSHNNEA
jgi:hypothetical protein